MPARAKAGVLDGRRAAALGIWDATSRGVEHAGAALLRSIASPRVALGVAAARPRFLLGEAEVPEGRRGPRNAKLDATSPLVEQESALGKDGKSLPPQASPLARRQHPGQRSSRAGQTAANLRRAQPGCCVRIGGNLRSLASPRGALGVAAERSRFLLG